MTVANSPLPEPLLKSARILIVEDEWAISALLAGLLREFGYEVVGPATHLPMAIDLATVEKIDCALLDLNVAGEPVYPVAKILDDRGVPFVFLTGYKRDQLPEIFRERPMLRKPFKDQQLSQILRDMLDLSVK